MCSVFCFLGAGRIHGRRLLRRARRGLGEAIEGLAGAAHTSAEGGVARSGPRRKHRRLGPSPAAAAPPGYAVISRLRKRSPSTPVSPRTVRAPRTVIGVVGVARRTSDEDGPARGVSTAA